MDEDEYTFSELITKEYGPYKESAFYNSIDA